MVIHMAKYIRTAHLEKPPSLCGASEIVNGHWQSTVISYMTMQVTCEACIMKMIAMGYDYSWFTEPKV